MMKKKSPARQQQYQQITCHEAYEFNPRQDYCRVLKEAKHHANESKQTSSSVHPEEESRKTGLEKKLKKSWKSSLISWWRRAERATANNNRQGRQHVSGPIYDHDHVVKKKKKKQWHRSTSSGPLTNLFKFTAKREVKESGGGGDRNIPYVSLHQQNNPRALDNNYGPLYVVT